MSYSTSISNVASLDLPWDKLRGCNILIAGATGMIGSCLVDVLMSRKDMDYHIYAAGRNEERAGYRFKDYLSDPHFHFLKQDILNSIDSEVNFHFIVHAASSASPVFFATKQVEVLKANIMGVSNLVEYGMEHGMDRFLYVSSGEVYGQGDGRVFTEDYYGFVDITSPRSCYPSGKRAAETLCASYGAEYGVDTVIARPCHIYGPNFTGEDNRVFAQFLRNVQNGEDIVMKSAGLQYRSWCYVVDCVSAILFVLLKGESGQAYNIANPDSNITIRELAEIVANIGGREVVTEDPSVIEQKGFNVVTKSVFSVDKLKALGWSPKHSMEKGIRETIDEMRKGE